jgi:flagellar motor switch protein FliN/FliY
MAKELLTREELNLLLSDEAGTPAPLAGSAPLFSPEDFTRLQGVLDQYLLPGVTAWAVLFSRTITLGTPSISFVSPSALPATEEAVVAEVNFFNALKGKAEFIMLLPAAQRLVALTLGSPEPPADFDEIHRSSFGAALKYLLAEMRSLIVKNVGRRLGSSEPIVRLWPAETTLEDEWYVEARIAWSVDGKPVGDLALWATIPLTKSLLSLADPGPRPAPPAADTPADRAARNLRRLTESRMGREADPKPEETTELVAGLNEVLSEKPAPRPTVRPQSPSLTAPFTPRPAAAKSTHQTPSPKAQTLPPATKPQAATPAQTAPRKSVAPAPLPAKLAPPEPPPATRSQSTGEVRVELGRTFIETPLALGQVLPLDRLAGESVDLLIDDQLIARGEVAVVGETLAVRITQTIPGRPAKSEPRGGGKTR